MKEVLTCPGCLEPFGITSAQRYEHFRRLDPPGGGAGLAVGYFGLPRDRLG